MLRNPAASERDVALLVSRHAQAPHQPEELDDLHHRGRRAVGQPRKLNRYRREFAGVRQAQQLLDLGLALQRLLSATSGGIPRVLGARSKERGMRSYL